MIPPKPRLTLFLTAQSRRAFLTTAAALALTCTGRAASRAATGSLKSFELPDQFGKNHRFDFPRTRPLLLLVGDRKGSEEVDDWIAPLKEHWGKVADIAGIADVHGVPSFLRERIRNGIRERRPRELMLDFDGVVVESLAVTSKTANLFLLDPEGRIAVRVEGKPDEKKLAALRAVFERWAAKPGA